MDTAINNYSADYASNKFYENKYRQHYKLLEAKFPVNILTLDFDSSVLKAAEIDSMLDVWFSQNTHFLMNHTIVKIMIFVWRFDIHRI